MAASDDRRAHPGSRRPRSLCAPKGPAEIERPTRAIGAPESPFSRSTGSSPVSPRPATGIWACSHSRAGRTSYPSISWGITQQAISPSPRERPRQSGTYERLSPSEFEGFVDQCPDRKRGAILCAGGAGESARARTAQAGRYAPRAAQPVRCSWRRRVFTCIYTITDQRAVAWSES